DPGETESGARRHHADRRTECHAGAGGGPPRLCHGSGAHRSRRRGGAAAGRPAGHAGLPGRAGMTDYLLQQIVNGLTLGSLYALVAIGFSLIYGVIRLVNFAHGDLMMIGGFMTLGLVGTGH